MWGRVFVGVRLDRGERRARRAGEWIGVAAAGLDPPRHGENYRGAGVFRNGAQVDAAQRSTGVRTVSQEFPPR